MKKTILIAACVLILLVAAGLITHRRFFNAHEAAPPEPSVVITDRFGAPMRTFLNGKEVYSAPVSLDMVSPWLILSLVTVEDKRFFTHGGVDVLALTRALWQNTREGKVVSGASTITQQLARTLFPREKNIWGKIKEAAGALMLEKTLSKHEILEEYFNNVEFYNNVKGVEAAAQFYFGVNAASVSLSQAAFLSAMLKSPAKYNPLKNFNETMARQKTILKKMLDNSYITQEIYDISAAEPVVITAAARPFSAPHLAEVLRARGGQITTTLDGRLQNIINGLVPEYIKKMSAHNITNAAVIVVENKTGETLAYLGSADYFDQEHSGAVNGVTMLRQPGSALKPFIYALALENGYTDDTLIEDKDIFFEGGFRPKNYDEAYHGALSLRVALACSYNVPVVRVTESLGVHKVLAKLHEFGFSSLDKSADVYGLGLALGNGEVRLHELARAYSALASGGVLKPLRYTFDMPGEKPVRVLSVEAAQMITDILSDNSARAGAFGKNSPLYLPFDFAAKTGTSKDYKDNWAVGYTTRYTVAVWVGNFSGEPMQKSSGITGAAPLLKDIVLETEKLYPSGAFARLVKQKIAPASPEQKHDIIFFPANGDVFQRDPAAPRGSERINIKTALGAACKINERALAKTAKIWWELEEGEHTLSCALGARTELVKFIVL